MLSSNLVKQEPSSLSSSLNNNPLVVPPSTPIYATFDSLSPLDSLSAFGIVDDDSNEAASTTHPAANRDALTHDPFLSSTSFGFDNEMDIGGGFT